MIQLNDGDFTDDALNTTRNFYMVADAAGSYHTIFNETFTSANAWLQRVPQLSPLMSISMVRFGAEKAQKLLAQRSSETNEKASARNYGPLAGWCLAKLKKAYGNPIFLYLPDESEPPSAIGKALHAAARRTGATLIDIRADFEVSSRAYEPVRGFNNTMPGQGHLNRTGHRLVAKRLVEVFTQGRQP